LPRLASVAATTLTAAALAACAASHSGEIEPRYVAVHNALAAMGLVQIGPIQEGSLAEGREARFTFDFAAQCVTLVTVGGDGVRDLDATLLDTQNNAVAHDTTKEPEAVLRACVDTPGTYTLVVKMAGGAGSFVAAAWSGGVGPVGGAATGGGASPASQAAGTCESPIPLTAGTVTGSTSRGESEQEGSCRTGGDAKELVYKLEVAERQHVIIDVRPQQRFDSVLYIRKDDCTDAAAEIACNDDAPQSDRSRLDLVLDPGTYYVFVDGYGHDSGSFRMTVQLSDVPTSSDMCRRSRALASGIVIDGNTAGTFDNAGSSCGNGARGPDAPYRLDVARRSRVRVDEHSDDLKPVVHLRRVCADEQSEVACADTGLGDKDATYVGYLEPGTYTVIADSSEPEASGRYTLLAETAPEQGSGVQGDGCSDAVPLTVGTVSGDTFLAHDDVSGRCGGAGAPDVVYRLELTRRTRVTTRMEDEEGHHVFVLQRACGDRSTEVACTPNLDEVLGAGVYFLAVDGATPEGFGKFSFDLRERDVAGQDAACKSPQTLVSGRAVNATTAGQADKFTASCPGGRDDTQGSPDRIFKIVLAQRSHVSLALATPTWDGVVALRRSCVEIGLAGRGSEIACQYNVAGDHKEHIETVLDAGTYFVLVEGRDASNEGPFTLEYKAEARR
jgi:hypothetical protein